MGGGLLGFNVSKLVSKEVSKILRNFTLAPEKACHCEDERSEDVAIAKSLNINEITTQSSIARNDNIRHAELADCELRAELDGNFSLAPLGRGIKGEGLTKNKIAQQMRDDKLRHPELVSGSQSEIHSTTFHKKGRRKIAFTLAEVLITLGIIGVVASLTLPSIVHNVQKVVLKNQFKRVYSNFYNAIKYVQVQNGAPYACYYWDKNPYGDTECSEFNEYGSCIGWTLAGGAQIPNDYNGKATDCRRFTEDLMKTLKTVKFCETKPLENGCITNNYRGIDKVLEEQYPNIKQDPNRSFSDKQIKEKNPTFITADGVLYSKYLSMTGYPDFIVDINGYKGPNKWGYDIFSIKLRGNEINGITKIEQVNTLVEKGGMTIDEILSGKK